jgi:hypothetical protein
MTLDQARRPTGRGGWRPARQVVDQTRTRVLRGVTDSAGKLISVYEPWAQILRRGKRHRPTEFGDREFVSAEMCSSTTHPAAARPGRRPAGPISHRRVTLVHRSRSAIRRVVDRWAPGEHRASSMAVH